MGIVELSRVGTRISGAAGVNWVDLDFLRSRGGMHGASLGMSVDGYWRLESNSMTRDPVGLFLGRYGDSPVYLRSELHLTSYSAVRHLDLFGTIGADELSVHLAPLEAPAYGPRVLGIDGYFARRTVTMFAAFDDGGARSAKLEGNIGGRPVILAATRKSIAGHYEGPAELFPLLVGALSFFV